MATTQRSRRAALGADVPAHQVPLTALAGVGPARAAKLATRGWSSVHDLLCTLPRKVELWPAAVAIAQAKLALGSSEPVRRVRGTVERLRFSRFGRRSLVRVTVRDPSDSIDVLFFNQPWLRERFRKGDDVELVGRVVDVSGTAIVATRLGSPAAPLPAPGSREPQYPATEGVTQEWLRALIGRALAEHGQRVRERLDEESLSAHGLPALPDAVREVHAPRDEASYAAARRRMTLEPLLGLQASLLARRQARMHGAALAASIGDDERLEILAHLPFRLTRGQERVADELRRDLARSAPMRRLVQGDVGSGKTVLGLYAAAVVRAAGGQAAFLAPTEILAEQHYRGLAPLCERLRLRTALLTGSLGARERRATLEALRRGQVDLAFGTHALLEPAVEFRRLGLAVIDEQHRFGVAQRERLFEKGRDVHGLLMTATPIPRSLALTVYGDLDVSVLREKPPGRGAITTHWLEHARELARELGPRLERGERVFWVVPRIEGDDDEALGAEQRFQRLRSKPWARFGVELVHGRMPAAERSARVERFRDGSARILVATTVIEVGVDVPQASAIVIEGAERLGLAQLHQLRGRVGRGPHASACYLLGKAVARERLEFLERTDDGFAIAEEDLRRRGMGDLVGLRQAGENSEGLALGDLDLGLLVLARELVGRRPEFATAYAGLQPLS